MTMIDQRSSEAVTRLDPGHWEGDLITGELNRSAIGTLVDRATRFTILCSCRAGIPPRPSATLWSPRQPAGLTVDVAAAQTIAPRLAVVKTS